MKFNLPRGTSVVLKDSEGFDVDADVFDELVRTTNTSFKILFSNKSGKKLARLAAMFNKYK